MDMEGTGGWRWMLIPRWAGTSQGPRVEEELKTENEGREVSPDVVMA